ncbi:coiled-coil domain-containing 115 isoform X1 [Chlorella sorokiniana]|uniref:Vacuolar ATPase assembly protein VMA22 n=1 Tax=Chlorella sorokiniana TaxID=3076 RepID=A0A2P6U226_CHLSO|nr:coiled-coil domain-containing 115 isoform X1 [Chlorella sorokiniana]|eukprot:PRW60365.1 coiled-coil domain-containing 115 isoform X1 [Chlorella sorokiniana]
MSESAFEEALDAAQEYLALQEALGAALRAGFLSLAQARYSMGADRVSALQLPAHMTATARLQTDQGKLGLVRMEPKARLAASSSGTSSRSSAAGAANDSAAASSTESIPDSADAAPAEDKTNAAQAAQPALQAAAQGSGAQQQQSGGEPGDVAALLQRMQLLAQQSDSLVDELAAKYCSGDGDAKASGAAAAPSSSGAGGDLDGEYEEVAHPSRPLHWFGSLVAPSLRDAEGHFCRALELVVQAANAQAALRRGLERQRAAAAAGGEAAAAPGDGAAS